MPLFLASAGDEIGNEIFRVDLGRFQQGIKLGCCRLQRGEFRNGYDWPLS